MGDGRTLTLCARCGRGYPPAEMRPRGDGFVCGVCADAPDLETVVLGMIGEETGSAYDRWMAQPPSSRTGHICDEPSEFCTDWVIEHVRTFLDGGFVPYSWRQAFAPLRAMIPYLRDAAAEED